MLDEEAVPLVLVVRGADPEHPTDCETQRPPRPLSGGRQREFKCHLCPPEREYRTPIAFGTRMELEEHLNSHTGEKPFWCDKCDAKFNRRSTLWNHKRIHSDNRPFVCSLCHHRFKWKNSLKCHQLMHARRDELDPEVADEDRGAKLSYAAALTDGHPVFGKKGCRKCASRSNVKRETKKKTLDITQEDEFSTKSEPSEISNTSTGNDNHTHPQDEASTPPMFTGVQSYDDQFGGMPSEQCTMFSEAAAAPTQQQADMYVGMPMCEGAALPTAQPIAFFDYQYQQSMMPYFPQVEPFSMPQGSANLFSGTTLSELEVSPTDQMVVHEGAIHQPEEYFSKVLPYDQW